VNKAHPRPSVIECKQEVIGTKYNVGQWHLWHTRPFEQTIQTGSYC